MTVQETQSGTRGMSLLTHAVSLCGAATDAENDDRKHRAVGIDPFPFSFFLFSEMQVQCVGRKRAHQDVK